MSPSVRIPFKGNHNADLRNFLTARTNVALTIKIAIIAFATLAIYHQDFLGITNEAVRSDLMSHVLAIPFIFAYLVYRKRKMLKDHMIRGIQISRASRSR